MFRYRGSFLLLFLLFCLNGFAQQQLYSFWKDDSMLRKKYYEQTMKKKETFIAAAGKLHAEDYKEIYNDYFENVGYLWQSKRTITTAEINNYLQSIVQKIISVNPELKNTDARVVFSRDGWPNAMSMGEGSIVVDAGLVMYLSNEAELAYVICHELSHYYLDHTNKAIRKQVETMNDENFKKELKALSKQEYGVGASFEKLVKKMTFGFMRHSREDEAEADRQGFLFLKKTGFDCNGITSCLQLLDRINDTSLYHPFVPETTFNFENYPFKKKWTQKQSAIFGQMSGDDSPLTQAEKDSLKTHPDCKKRIELLQDSIMKVTPGKTFLVNEKYFNDIKKQFYPEITEQAFRNDDLARNLYNSLLMLQKGENLPLSVYSIARDFNILYQRQKEHKLGDFPKESRYNSFDLNLLLRMIDRLHLEEIASINYYFCKHYETQMTEYKDFQEEMRKAKKSFSEYQTGTN